MSGFRSIIGVMGIALVAVAIAACSNDPYPASDSSKRVIYSNFDDPPRTLDPAVAYSTTDHMVTGNVYDTLLEYHFLKRPFSLIPGLAAEIPKPEARADGTIAYRFALREGIFFQEDPCFAHFAKGTPTRIVRAADIAFSLHRIADPNVNSPVIVTFGRIIGFADFSARLQALRAEDEEGMARLSAREQYERAGGIEGVRVLGETEFEIVLDSPYPQILYWFAMPFTTPLPWEAIAYYDGQEGRAQFAEHPVGTGPFVLSIYEKEFRIVFERNPRWYGAMYPEAKAPGAVYPSEGEQGDLEAGLLNPKYVGKSLPFIDRVEYRREKEVIPTFNKFLQGYYDASGVIQESFDMVIQEDDLSPEMEAQDIGLMKAVNPDVYYLGFNMDDPVVGHAAGARGRKLRQAMSMAIETEAFTERFANRRGVPAHSPLPPGIFGYDPEYRNPYRSLDLEAAARLLEEAGFPSGVDPATGGPLALSFDTPDTSAAGRARYQFFVDAWRKLGIDVTIAATNYNQFQEKVRNGSYQLFMWGWVADYPDPENFLFLLQGAMGRTASGGPNTANFADARYDELFLAMKDMENGPERLAIMREMRDILEEERPWIELFHRESYALYHGWLANVKPVGLSFSTLKYRDLDPEAREAWRAERNQPIRWPLYVSLVLLVGVAAPGVRTFLRERQ